MAESWMQAYARSLVCQALGGIRTGRLVIALAYLDGADKIQLGDQDASDSVLVTVHDANAWTRLVQAFDLGFSEAYMLQEVDCDDVVGLCTLYLNNQEALGTSRTLFISQLIPRLARLVFKPPNTTAHARLNASFHYDTSNTLFCNFLDSSMTYSCGIWSGNDSLEPAQKSLEFIKETPDSAHNPLESTKKTPDSTPKPLDSTQESLNSAQQRKMHLIIDKLRLTASHHLLDIGCGWGTLLIEAVQRTGCRATGITPAAAQQLLAEGKIREAGLAHKIDIVLCDYRQAPRLEGGYDAVVSLEMLEHVGDAYMTTFFECISNLLNPKTGIMVIQGSTMTPKTRLISPDIPTFIDSYIFPGGYLPTVNQLLRAIHDASAGSLEVEHVQTYGPHYAHTLCHWRRNFLRNWDNIRRDFVDKRPEATEQDIEAFRRKWLYYFQYTEAGFQARTIGNVIIVACRAPWLEFPQDVPRELDA